VLPFGDEENRAEGREAIPPVADTLKVALQELLRQYQDDAQIDALREGVRLLAEALRRCGYARMAGWSP
jgi:hypothetical protein